MSIDERGSAEAQATAIAAREVAAIGATPEVILDLQAEINRLRGALERAVEESAERGRMLGEQRACLTDVMEALGMERQETTYAEIVRVARKTSQYAQQRDAFVGLNDRSLGSPSTSTRLRWLAEALEGLEDQRRSEMENDALCRALGGGRNA